MLSKFRIALSFCLGLSLLLVACGGTPRESPANGQSNAKDAVAALKQLESLLNAGEVVKALNLFDDEAEIVEVQPSFLTFDEMKGRYQRYLSFGDPITYKNRDEVKAYLYSQMYNKFYSSENDYSEDEAKGVWHAQVVLYDSYLQMDFVATSENGKIKFLTATNHDLVNTRS